MAILFGSVAALDVATQAATSCDPRYGAVVRWDSVTIDGAFVEVSGLVIDDVPLSPTSMIETGLFDGQAPCTWMELSMFESWDCYQGFGCPDEVGP